jgi:hypothetical protein
MQSDRLEVRVIDHEILTKLNLIEHFDRIVRGFLTLLKQSRYELHVNLVHTILSKGCKEW